MAKNRQMWNPHKPCWSSDRSSYSLRSPHRTSIRQSVPVLLCITWTCSVSACKVFCESCECKWPCILNPTRKWDSTCRRETHSACTQYKNAVRSIYRTESYTLNRGGGGIEWLFMNSIKEGFYRKTVLRCMLLMHQSNMCSGTETLMLFSSGLKG